MGSPEDGGWFRPEPGPAAMITSAVLSAFVCLPIHDVSGAFAPMRASDP